MDEIQYLGENISRSFDVGDGLILDLTYYEFDGQIAAVLWDRHTNDKRVIVDIFTNMDEDWDINCAVVDMYHTLIEDIDYYKDKYRQEVEK
jgi:hypothetical protein